MLRVKSFQFDGSCEGCGGGGPHRCAVQVETDLQEAWYCAACAKSLAKRLLTALDDATAKVKMGMHYRHDTWAKKPNAVTSAARS